VTNNKEISQREFVWLMACLMSLVALSIDSILPAMMGISESLGVTENSDTQLILSFIFLGMAPGLLVYGPIADSFGRKNTLFLGIGIYIVGCLLSSFATNLEVMLVGRFLQGFGGASCRIVSLAMIRDKFSGQKMGQIMSVIMVIFILVPALAPSLGQALIWMADWRAIFIFGIAFSGFGGAWLLLRQSETLKPEHKRDFSFRSINEAITETIKHPVSRLYMIASGVMFGSFVAYLSLSQSIFQELYHTGDQFALYFGGLALAIGLSSFTNSKLVQRFRMESLVITALIMLTISSTAFELIFSLESNLPGIVVLMTYLVITFFCFGILFGTLNTLAVQPLGHIAGTATSVIASIQTFISVGVGALIGQFYQHNLFALVMGFVLTGAVSVVLVYYANKYSKNLEHQPT
jgi:DHA1 family bicyclomycin/chloramphenicol resistance-like MFS transporter